MMDIRNLFKGATVFVKSIGGKKQVWVQAGRQQFPIANLTELEEEYGERRIEFPKTPTFLLTGKKQEGQEMRYCSSRFLFEGVRRWGW